jgi:hypothetical protein
VDDEDSDEEVVPQSPLMLDLVRHAAVHGFTMDHLYEAELALQNSSVQRRVEQTLTPASMNSSCHSLFHLAIVRPSVVHRHGVRWRGKRW